MGRRRYESRIIFPTTRTWGGLPPLLRAPDRRSGDADGAREDTEDRRRDAQREKARRRFIDWPSFGKLEIVGPVQSAAALSSCSQSSSSQLCMQAALQPASASPYGCMGLGKGDSPYTRTSQYRRADAFAISSFRALNRSGVKFLSDGKSQSRPLIVRPLLAALSFAS